MGNLKMESPGVNLSSPKHAMHKMGKKTDNYSKYAMHAVGKRHFRKYLNQDRKSGLTLLKLMEIYSSSKVIWTQPCVLVSAIGKNDGWGAKKPPYP